MFDELRKLAKRLDGMKVTVPVSSPPDEEGYIDRECPAPDCKFSFKVYADDWRDIVRDEEVFCPFCGHGAHAEQWFTSEQVEHAKQQALAQVKGMFGEAMRRDAEAFNRRQPRDSFIKMSITVDRRPREIVLPAAAAQPMRLKITCDACACRYAVIGSAYFCPACGHNAAERVLRQSLDTIRSAMDAIPLVRSSLPDQDAAENTVRLLVEGGLQNAVMAFQRYAEAIFAKQVNPPKIRRNLFQNLSEGSAAWRQAFGKDYADHLDASELAALSRFFQQRHLLAHKDGLVDEDYVKKSGDGAYRPGQRLVVRDEAVRHCVNLVQKLAAGLAGDVP